jgi:hypothetical protein
MVGTAHCEFTVQSQELREVPGFQSEQGNPKTVHVAHLTAAAARLRYVLEDSEHSAPTPVQLEEAVSLSRDFGLPCPQTRFHFKTHSSGNKPLENRNLISAYYVSGRALRRILSTNGSSLVRDSSGAAADGDALQRVHIAADNRHQRRVSAKQFMRQIVDQMVDYVTKDPDVYDLLLAQSSDGSFKPGARFFSSTGISPSDFEQRKPGQCTDAAWATAIAWHIGENVVAQRHREKLMTLMMSRAHQFLRDCQQEGMIDTAARSFAK